MSLLWLNKHAFPSGKSVAPPAESRSLALGSRAHIGITALVGRLLLPLAGVKIVEKQTHFVVDFFKHVLFNARVVLHFRHDAMVLILCPFYRFLSRAQVLIVVNSESSRLNLLSVGRFRLELATFDGFPGLIKPEARGDSLVLHRLTLLLPVVFLIAVRKDIFLLRALFDGPVVQETPPC